MRAVFSLHSHEPRKLVHTHSHAEVAARAVCVVKDHGRPPEPRVSAAKRRPRPHHLAALKRLLRARELSRRSIAKRLRRAQQCAAAADAAAVCVVDSTYRVADSTNRVVDSIN